ncbi:DUF6895 family protein [Streptomyces sp. CB01580]|uniref:DUF6895 family protein n=1 Tax=Streptomyces sp. CB01580 TaxID=1703933 RepID=UPI00093EDDD7|nr:hypothetical protein [Streptomyces sp. CB01580]
MNGAADEAYWPALPAHAGRVGEVFLAEEEAARQVLAGALEWIEARLDWFAPGRWEEFLPRRPFRPGPLLELLGLVRVLGRSGIVPVTAPLPSRALDLAEETIHEPEFGRGLRRGDAFFPYHLNLTALLELLGRPQPTLRASCQALLTADAGGHCRPYKPVLSRIELRYFVDRGGFTAPGPLPGLGPLYRQSIAARGADVLQLTGDETYALTHVLLYATDFGHHNRLPCRGESVARVREIVRVLLGVHLARGSLDLLAELLLCEAALDACREDGHVPRLGRGTDPGMGPAAKPGPDLVPVPGASTGPGSGLWRRAGWNALAAAQRPDGAVPGPVHRPEVLAGLAGDKAAAYLFGTCYHTTLAAALAAARKPRTVPWPSDPVALTEPVGLSDPSDLAGLTEPTGLPLPRAHPEEIRRWLRTETEAARDAPPAARAEPAACLGPLLALAVRAHDPAVLTDVLRAAERLGHGDDPLARSAAALLAAWGTAPVP